MLIPRFVVWVFSVGMVVLGAGPVAGQSYPNKHIRIVTATVGGTLDFGARLIAQGISGSLGQAVIVDNRGLIAAEIVAKAPPDGYTLIYYTSPFWLTPFLRDNVRWDPVKDFAPISLTDRAPNFLVVHQSVAAKSVKELIALAKARPGELNYAGASVGSSAHLSAELFKAMAGVDMVAIHYKGGGPSLNALIAGEVQLIFSPAGSVIPYLKTGRLRALAVTSAVPSAMFPELPTVAASGLPGYEAVTIVGMFAPAGTPAAIINLLNREIVQALKRAEVKEKFSNLGVETVGSSPEQFAAKMKSEMVKWGKVIKNAGIRAD